MKLILAMLFLASWGLVAIALHMALARFYRWEGSYDEAAVLGVLGVIGIAAAQVLL